MFNSIADFDFKKLINRVDWKLLIFLVLFINIKVPVKIIAIVFMYTVQFNFKFGFKFKNSRLPLFYLLIIPIAFTALIINKNYQNYNYLLVFLAGIGCWLLSMLAVHQIKLTVEKTETEKIHGSIIAFFVINAIVSFYNLALIVWKTGSINPYTFRGLHQTYFIMTGDYIKGVSFDISSTNAIISALGVIYFLVKKEPFMLFICMITLLLTCSNLINLMLLFVILTLFILKSSKDQKSLIVICLMFFLIFMLKISPQNTNYSEDIIKTTLHIQNKIADKPIANKLPITQVPDSLLNTEEKRQKIAAIYLDSVRVIREKEYGSQNKTYFDKSIPLIGMGRIYIKKADTNSEENYLSKEMEPDRKVMLDFISAHRASLPLSSRTNYIPLLPGKATGIIQSITYLSKHPDKIIAGIGIGNFSSKIAFRASGMGIRGRYPENHTYINNAFLSNHLDLYMSFFSKEVSFRSVKNNPFSVYDQLLAEYGLLGLLSFIIFYFGFFAKNYKILTYGIPILLFLVFIFFIDYWFEQLSVMILFELMLFLNIKEGKNFANNE
jgi:hypothetical protein